ncbi:MAG: PIN domain-containing protein [Isosphaeraceae bacterium]
MACSMWTCRLGLLKPIGSFGSSLKMPLLRFHGMRPMTGRRSPIEQRDPGRATLSGSSRDNWRCETNCRELPARYQCLGCFLAGQGCGDDPSATAGRSIQCYSLLLCSIVLAELIQDAHKSGPAHCAANLALIAELRQKFICLPFDEETAEQWGRIRHELGQQGLLIGPHHLLIASIAVSRNLILVTHNTKEFNRVPGLSIEDWQAP